MKSQYSTGINTAILAAICVLVTMFFVSIYRDFGNRENTLKRLADTNERVVAEMKDSQQWDSQNDPDAPEVVALESGKVGALPSRDEWNPDFYKTKRAYIKDNHPLCQGCGRSPEDCGHVTHDLHHVVSVSRILTEKNDDGSMRWPRSMLTDAGNMIYLCRPAVAFRAHNDDSGCHFKLGHYGKSWDDSDPDVRKHAAAQLKKLHPGKTYEKLVEEYFEDQPIAVPQDATDKRSRRAKMPAKTEVAP